MPLPVNWPEHLVHEDYVHNVLGHEADDETLINGQDAVRLESFRQLIQRACASGRLRRLVVKDAITQEVMGRGYPREELHTILGLGPTRLLIPRLHDPLPNRPVAGWSTAAASLRRPS